MFTQKNTAVTVRLVQSGPRVMYLIEKTKDTEYRAIFELMKANMYLMQSEIGLEWKQSEIESNYRNKLNFSIYKKGDLAAFVSLAINKSDVFIHTLQVKQKYQNGMAGYTAFRHILELAKEHQVSTLKCCVFKNNPVRHMYERLGFRETSF